MERMDYNETVLSIKHEITLNNRTLKGLGVLARSLRVTPTDNVSRSERDAWGRTVSLPPTGGRRDPFHWPTTGTRDLCSRSEHQNRWPSQEQHRLPK